MQRYAEACGVLSGMAASPDAEEYNRVRSYADDARLDYELTRLELERHRENHD